MAGLKRYFAIFIIFLVIGVNSLSPFSVYALDEIPTDTPTPAIEQQTDPTPTPTITSTPPTETIDNTTQTNSTEAHDSTTGDSNTGTNISTASAELNPKGIEEAIPTSNTTGSQETSSSVITTQDGLNSSVTTSNSTTIVAIDNTVNTNSVNSQVINQTINIFVENTEDIDLSTPFTLAYTIISQDKNTNPIVNVSLTDAKNYVYLANDVLATASTGNNEIAEGENATIKTGDAYSVVSLMNKANFTVVDSVIHIVTINIFGNFSGNIVLPDFRKETVCTSCGVSATMKNAAAIENTVITGSNTGNNTIDTASSSSTITTGTSHSIINIVDIVNTNAIGAIFQKLFINVLGKWTGSFLGWDSLEPQNGGNNLNISNNNGDCDCDNPFLTMDNTAIIRNTIQTKADTGNNTIHGETGKIHTGNAYSAVSLINFINSNFFKTNGLFAFVNVFGNWSGNIGGVNKFIAETTQEENPQEKKSNDQNQEKINGPESGGKLMVTNKNNVGVFVNPGDTVTFFVDTKNTGTGTVYGAKLLIGLYKDGEFMGGPSFDLKDIEAQKTKRLTTGLVLTKNAPAGNYTAVSYVSGTTGIDTTVDTSAESYFTVSSKQNGNILAATTRTGDKTGGKKEIKIAGAYLDKGDNYARDMWIYYAIIIFLSVFIGIRTTKRKALVKALFIKTLPFYTRLQLLKSFLL